MTAAANKGVTFTAPLMVARLRRHYLQPGPLPGGVFAHEVQANGHLGLTGNRRCDAIAVGFTTASGRRMIGHEIKVSRGDWLAELSKVGKADWWADACHEWWVVAPSVDVVHPEELPHGWGLMVVSTRTTTRLDKVVRAAVKDPHDPPWEAVRAFLARCDTLRAQTEHAHRAQVEQQVRDESAKREQQQREAGRARELSPDERRGSNIARLLREATGGSPYYLPVTDEEVAAAALHYHAVVRHTVNLTAGFRRVENDLRRLMDSDRLTDLQKTVAAAETLRTQPLTQEPADGQAS